MMSNLKSPFNGLDGLIAGRQVDSKMYLGHA